MNTHPQMRADTFHCSYAEPHWALQMHSGLLWVGLNDSSFVASSIPLHCLVAAFFWNFTTPGRHVAFPFIFAAIPGRPPFL